VASFIVVPFSPDIVFVFHNLFFFKKKLFVLIVSHICKTISLSMMSVVVVAWAYSHVFAGAVWLRGTR